MLLNKWENKTFTVIYFGWEQCYSVGTILILALGFQ